MEVVPGIQHAKIVFLRTRLRTEAENNLFYDYKICAILFDEVQLLPSPNEEATTDGCENLGNGRLSENIADRALTFMIQGVCTKINSVIAYYFIKRPMEAEKLAEIITEVIRAVEELGYKVVATVCDHAPTNAKALELLANRTNSNDSHYFVLDGRKINIIYNVPHLYLSIRNDFREDGEIIIGDRKAKWAHLVRLEEENLELQEVTKLHLNPTEKSLKDPNLAIQLLSRNVAGFLHFYSKDKTLSSELVAELNYSAKVIADLDLLYNCTTGPWGVANVIKGMRERVRKNTFHHKRWLEFRELLKTLRYPNLEGEAKLRSQRCIDCYVSNLLALQDIWKCMESNHISSLNLRRFNLDILQNTFEKIKKHCPNKENPTCQQFCSSLRKIEESADRRKAERERERGFFNFI